MLQVENIKLNNIDEAATIVVAVSCGVDSMVLLDLLRRLKKKVIIAHVNHNMRKSSSNEYNFIKQFALENNISFEYLELNPKDIKGNFHHEAHKIRYDFFFNVAKKHNANFIATGHHLDDNIETILMRKYQNKYFYSLRGITEYTKDGVCVIRPLIKCTKDEIYQYAINNNIQFFEDESNKKVDYLRNKIRNIEIPKMKELNNNFYQDMMNELEIYQEKSVTFDNQVFHIFENDKINIEKFNTLTDELKIHALYKLLKESASLKRIKTIINSLNKGKLNKRFEFDNKILFKEYNYLYLSNKENYYNDTKLVIDTIGIYRLNDNYKIRISNQNNGKLCYNKIQLPIVVRTFKHGDDVSFDFGHKKLSRVFIDQKISKTLRHRLPVVTNTKDQIIFVHNVCKSNIDYQGEYYLEILEEENA